MSDEKRLLWERFGDGQLAVHGDWVFDISPRESGDYRLRYGIENRRLYEEMLPTEQGARDMAERVARGLA